MVTVRVEFRLKDSLMAMTHWLETGACCRRFPAPETGARNRRWKTGECVITIRTHRFCDSAQQSTEKCMNTDFEWPSPPVSSGSVTK